MADVKPLIRDGANIKQLGSGNHLKVDNIKLKSSGADISAGGTGNVIAVQATGVDFSEARLVLPQVSSNPGSPVEGDMWFNTTNHALYVSAGGSNCYIVMTAA